MTVHETAIHDGCQFYCAFLQKDLEHSETLRLLLICVGTIVVSMGTAVLAIGSAHGPAPLVGAGLCLTSFGCISIATSIYLACKQRAHREHFERSTLSSHSASSRKVCLFILYTQWPSSSVSGGKHFMEVYGMSEWYAPPWKQPIMTTWSGKNLGC